MAINCRVIYCKAIYCHFLRCLALVLLFFAGLAPFLEAQTAGYFIDPNSDEPRFIQRLAWSSEHALRYEVVIEREEGGSWRNYLREFTTELFIDVSLPPGIYRFHVIPYDVLNRPGEGSQWMPVEVRRALKPELFGSSQELIDSYNGTVLVLNINGNNIVSGAEIYLRDLNGTRVIPGRIETHNGRNVQLFFDSRVLSGGEYELYVKNPGGLEAVIGGINIAYPEPEPEPEPEVEPDGALNRQRPFLINAGAAWMPVIPIYGKAFGEDISLLSGTVGISVVFPISTIYIGPEVTVSLYSFGGGDNNMLAVGLNLLAQKWLPNRTTAINFRLGAGYVLPLYDDSLSINIGVSFLWLALRNFYVEDGIDYANLSNFAFDNIPSGCFRPRLGIGAAF